VYVNVATREQLLGLPYMEKYIVDAIIDWRDQDENPGAEGVEGGYYENLPFRYRIRNGPFRTIRELLLVKNVTEGLFYGEDTNFNGRLDYNERDGDQSPPADDGDDELDEGWIAYLTCYSYEKNVDAYGNKRVNINQGDEGQLETSLGIRRPVARWIVQRRQNNQFQSIADLVDDNSPQKPPENPSSDSDQAEPLDLQTFRSIADKITVTNDEQIPGRVNINTASKYVLAALLGGDDGAEQLAEGIVAYRKGLYGGMQSIADVMNVASMNIAAFKRIASYITTRSDVYSIRCVATADRGGYRGAKIQTQTVVDRNSSPCQILYWYQGAGD
jgi:DNA uptake protein ComE-like DNA-binding protein